MRIMIAAASMAFAVTAWPSQSLADPTYKLVYWYEVGGYQNASCGGGGCGCSGTGNHSVHVNVFDHEGTMLGNVRVEDADNPGFFTVTSNNPADKPGYAELPLFINDTPRLRVNDSGLASDVTPEMIENRAPTFGHYSWECAFMRVPDGVDVTFDATLLGTPNLSGGDGCHLDAPFTASLAYYDIDPSNWASDAFTLDTSAPTYGQTFVANGNRVVAAKFQVTVGALQDLRYGVRIRENGPAGAIVGPTALSRPMKSDDYFTQTVRWPLDGPAAAPVVSGQTYFAEIFRADQPTSINLYLRDANVFPNGQAYRSGVAVAGRDIMGKVALATFVAPPAGPEIELSTTVLNPVADTCTGTQSQSFTVRNAGSGTLAYTVTDNQPWLYTDPVNGTSTGEPDTITVYYNTTGLTIGMHAATITVTDPGAVNSPQAVTVNLDVQVASCPGDLDGDCDVDLSDFGIFQQCMTGPGVIQLDPACAGTQLTPNDLDVDIEDFGLFQACLSGANVPCDPTCTIVESRRDVPQRSWSAGR